MTQKSLRISPLLPPAGHEHMALQFSGGKDSLAIAHLLRPYWDQLTFYHVDTGDLLPEVRKVVCDMQAIVPRFVRIDTNSAEWTGRVGLPSDLVPTSCTPAGLIIGMGGLRIVDRFDCCASNIMAPMHERMLADGITLVIRGTKRADFARMPAESGPTGGGYDLWLPIADWSHDDVFAYLAEIGVTLPRFYETRVNAPECATCPAWWNEGRAAYLKKHHPDLAAAYSARLQAVANEVMPVLATLQAEMANAALCSRPLARRLDDIANGGNHGDNKKTGDAPQEEERCGHCEKSRHARQHIDRDGDSDEECHTSRKEKYCGERPVNERAQHEKYRQRKHEQQKCEHRALRAERVGGAHG